MKAWGLASTGPALVRFVVLGLIVAVTTRGAAEEFADAIHAHLQRCVDASQLNIGIVVGLVDKHGSHVVAYGRLDNSADAQVDGDTLFEIGSDTKTFTALLLAEMVERGQMKLDDPVAEYLPAPVRMPTYSGKAITLRHLATHTSGLPNVPGNLEAKRAENPFADYTVEQLYAFLSSYELTREPGATSEYSNLGMGLLGHVIAREARSSYEALVIERICRPLSMESTRVTLTPEMETKFAAAHNEFGERISHWDVSTLAGAGALRSTAGDLLKYLAAQLDLVRSPLTPLMRKTQESGLGWYAATDATGTKIFYHGGGTGGHRSFTGFDMNRRRGVVVLTNSKGIIDIEALGRFLLRSQWDPALRPAAATASNRDEQSTFVGRYEMVSGSESPGAVVRKAVAAFSRAALYSVAICALGAVVVCIWRGGVKYKPAMVIGGLLVVLGIAVAGLMVTSASEPKPPLQGKVGIRRVGYRLIARAGEVASPDHHAIFPPGGGELLAESELRFFERLSGRRIEFSRDRDGNVAGFTAYYDEEQIYFAKLSEEPPPGPKLRQQRVAIRLSITAIDALVGQYRFPPSSIFPAGSRTKVWREGDQLFWQEQGENAIPGAIELHPQSETKFFTTLDAAQIDFRKNPDGDVTGVAILLPGQREVVGIRE